MKFTWRVFFFNDYFCIQKAIDNLLDEFLPRHKSVITSAASEDDDSDFESEDSTETVRIRDEEINQYIDKFNRLYNSENKEQSDESEDEEYISCNGCSSIQNLKEKVSAACTCGKCSIRRNSEFHLIIKWTLQRGERHVHYGETFMCWRQKQHSTW